MARYAYIVGGFVTNIISWDGVTPYAPVGATLVQTSVGQMGDTYLGGNSFSPNAVVQPRVNVISKASAVQAVAARLGIDVGNLIGVIAGTKANADIPQVTGDPPTGT